MTTPTAPPSAEQRAVRRASIAVFAVFVFNGFNFSSWAARLPAVRDALDLPADRMGLLLLVGSLGSIVALPLSGLVVTRFGAARSVLAFAVVNASGLVLAAVGVASGQVLITGAGLVVFGIGTGVWDASMNLEGAFVEQRLGRTVMPRYHAGFSVGTVIAAGLAALAAAADVPVGVHVPVAVGLSTLCTVIAVRFFLPAGHATSAPAPAGPDVRVEVPGRARSAFGAWLEPRTLLIGLVVLAAALTEGSANDWLSLAVVDDLGRDEAFGALTFALFVTAMTVMRFLGTGLLDRFGRVVVLRLCAGLALVGLLLFGLVPVGMLWLAMVGVVVWGMGAALGFPVGMSAASDDPMRAAARVSVVSTIGYTAFLAGPPLLGLLAHHVGYRHALLAITAPIVIGLLVVGVAAPPAPASAVRAPGEPEPADGERPTLGG